MQDSDDQSSRRGCYLGLPSAGSLLLHLILYNGNKFCFQLVTVNTLIYVQAIAKSFDFTQRPGILSGITISIYYFSF